MNNEGVGYDGHPSLEVDNSRNSEIGRLDAVRSCVDSSSDLMRSTDGMLRSAEGSLNAIRSIADSVGSSLVAWKQIDKEMLAMNLDFERFLQGLNTDLDKYRARIPLVEKQLDAVNANLSKILDFVLAMDAESEKEMDVKMKMMDRIDSFMNMISTTMMGLL